ncbi:MAG: DUF559 domain-containing protein [Deltaproteobacteria bacterium]|nr:DUF559 domain-containing protein [Deltaproteobacteria bacterium]MBI2342568.1 DUF559 domain-containing protein [Deltaproteobacteria bacterium]
MNLTKFAKSLRKRSTDTEMFLWQHLKAKRLEGFKFRRQEPNGSQHIDSLKDQERDR